MLPVRVLIADDHSILRAGIVSILQDMPEVEVVGEAADGRAALELVRKSKPDVVFMDIAMKGMNGLETTARIIRDFPEVRVLVLSMHANEEYVWQALRAGATGYLLKNARPHEIQKALQALVRGDTYFTPELSSRVVNDYLRRSGSEENAVEALTPRQREILQLLAEGKSTKEAARVLNISSKTVETHRAQLMHRLDIHDMPGLVRYAIRVGVIQVDR